MYGWRQPDVFFLQKASRKHFRAAIQRHVRKHTHIYTNLWQPFAQILLLLFLQFPLKVEWFNFVFFNNHLHFFYKKFRHFASHLTFFTNICFLLLFVINGFGTTWRNNLLPYFATWRFVFQPTNLRQTPG